MILAGFALDPAPALAALGDPEPTVRVAALGALERCGVLTPAHLLGSLHDPDPAVRRRAAELGVLRRGRGARSALPDALIAGLSDPDPLVVDQACATLGERRERRAVEALGAVADTHGDARCREAAVAALGAIGDPAGLGAVLRRLDDKPAVRRRVAVVLAAFDGPEVDAALERCRADHDWQVRQAVELLDRI